MTNLYSAKRVGVLVFAALIVAAGIAAYLVQNAKAAGRTLDATFCNGLCIQVNSQNGMGQGQMGSDSNRTLTLNPGNYTLTVDDTSLGHDFVLRSCPGEAVLCDQSQSTSDNDEALTTVAGEGTVTIQLHLTHGTYRLYCNAPLRAPAVGTHESMGMYVDLIVGGVGQVDTSQMS